MFLYLSDLSRKDRRIISKKYKIYFWWVDDQEGHSYLYSNLKGFFLYIEQSLTLQVLVFNEAQI